MLGGISSSLRAVRRAAKNADEAITEARGAIAQSKDVLSTVGRTAEDIETYVQRIRHIPIEDLARRFDYKSKVAVEEMLALSSFTKKALVYLAVMATLSIYLNFITKKG